MDGDIFRALADPTRRLLLDRLFEDGGQSLTQLEQAQPSMTRFGVMKHLRLLEAAGLVVSRKVGRERRHYLNPVPIREIHDRWLDKYRARAADLLIDLRSVLEDAVMQPETSPPTTAAPEHVFTIFIRATPAAIWRALTESEFTLRYYFASTVESDWRAGSPYAYRVDGEVVIEGTVIEADPPRRLVMTFAAKWDEAVAADPPSRISWEIADGGPGVCKLTVVHDGFPARTATYAQVSGGMPFILSALKTLLETGVPITPGAGRTAA